MRTDTAGALTGPPTCLIEFGSGFGGARTLSPRMLRPTDQATNKPTATELAAQLVDANGC